MSEAANAAECFACRKHRDRVTAMVPGGLGGAEDLVVVSHIATPEVLGRPGATSYLGHLIVEPWRHAPGLADLTDAEARSVGWWCSVSSRALREVARAEHVYPAGIGDAVPHRSSAAEVPRHPARVLVDQVG